MTLPAIKSAQRGGTDKSDFSIVPRSVRDRDHSPDGGQSSATNSPYTPRRAVLRSRVMTSRHQNGGFTIMPSWKDPHLSKSSTESPQAVLQTGGGSIPIQAVMPKPPNQFARPKVECVDGKVLQAANLSGGTGRSARFGAIWRPEMTNELHADLKLRLNNLSQFCRGGDVPRIPRRLDNFLRQLGDLCEFMEMPLGDKSFRSSYNFTKLQSFLRSNQVPDVSDVWAGLTELPTNGFLVFTILLVLSDVKWTFCYNSITHKICDCAERFGTHHCLVPADTDAVRRSSDENRSTKADFARQAKIEHLQRTERHFPLKLIQLGNAVKERFLDLGNQIPKKLEEFLSLTIPPSTLMWERFVVNFSSHVSVFDQYYHRFEVLYLRLVDKMLSSAMAPLQCMTNHSERLVLQPSDSFRPMETSMFCQRLGLLKRQVNFGGIGLTDFDPALLVKAKRVLAINTFMEVQAMSQLMIDRFEGLCRLLGDIKESNITPELCHNNALKESVLQLEEIWDQCQYVLAQKALDFMNELIEYIEKHMDQGMRWKLKIAVNQDLIKSQKDRKNAYTALYTTLPILMYLDEMQKDVRSEQSGGELYFSNFRDLFCPDVDRYNRLRSEIGKFDQRRFGILYNFVLSEGDTRSSDANQMQYFENVYKQLKDSAGFRYECSDLSKREAYGRAQWIVMHRLVQKVAPHIFPASVPAGFGFATVNEADDAGDAQEGARRSSKGRAFSRIDTGTARTSRGRRVTPPASLDAGAGRTSTGEPA